MKLGISEAGPGWNAANMKRKMAAVGQESAGEPPAGALRPAPAEEGDFLMGFGLFPGNRLLTLSKFPFPFSPHMARRRSTGFPLRPTLIGLAALLLAGGLIAYLRRPGTEDFAAGSQPFPAREFLDNFFGLRGNRYLVQGRITEQLRFGTDRTRLFALSVTDAALTEPCEVGLLVPASFGSLNIQTGQEFRILVEVDQDGLLRAVEIKKA